MRLLDKDLRGLPVITKKGDKVGKIAGISVDPEQHVIAHYVVSRSRSLSSMLPGELLIHPTQVLSLDDQMMVVHDSAIAVEAAAKKVRVSEAAGVTTAATRSEA